MCNTCNTVAVLSHVYTNTDTANSLAMDIIPPEYDEVTKERVYRQEWLEHFHYIGFEAAMRDFPAQYHALFPHGHQRPPPLPRTTQPPAVDSLPMEHDAKEGDARAASVASSPSSAGSSAPMNAQEGSRPVTESERCDARDPRSVRDRRPYVSRRDDHRRSTRDRRSDSDDDDDDKGGREGKRHTRHRHHRSDSPHRSTHHHSSSRRRRRSAEREDRQGRYATSRDDDSRRYHREAEPASSRSRVYNDRREDALRRRELNYRR